jgi:hypothetical protein
VRLHTGPHYSLEIEQPGGRTDQNGQFVPAVDQSQDALRHFQGKFFNDFSRVRGRARAA